MRKGVNTLFIIFQNEPKSRRGFEIVDGWRKMPDFVSFLPEKVV